MRTAVELLEIGPIVFVGVDVAVIAAAVALKVLKIWIWLNTYN